MKAIKFVCALSLVFSLAMIASCSEDYQSENDLYDQEAIYRDEVKNQDT